VAAACQCTKTTREILLLYICAQHGVAVEEMSQCKHTIACRIEASLAAQAEPQIGLIIGGFQRYKIYHPAYVHAISSGALATGLHDLWLYLWRDIQSTAAAVWG
jgi:hypothetical protein